MTTARIDFTTAFTPGARLVPVILVAGVPVVLTPAGVRPTTVAVTSGTVDALWWPSTGTLTETLPDASTFDPIKDLLDPRETFEVFERASPLKGDVRVEALLFSLLDTDGAATALLSAREARTSQTLASSVDATSTTFPLTSTTGFPASGIAAIGRETFTYASISGSDLVSSLITRGKYGSALRAHDAPAEHPPLVSAGGPRHWQSRLATLWLCVLSADGSTLTDPTLFYAGTVGAGVQLKGNLSRWSVPLDHITESLSRKIDTAPLDLYGFAHFDVESRHPLAVSSATFARQPPYTDSVQWSASATDNDGWHPSLSSFVAAADATLSAASSGTGRVMVDSNAKLVVRQRGNNGTPRWFSARAAWDTSVLRDYRVDDDTTPAAWVSADPAPEACFHLDGWVRIPSAVDFARIPPTLQWVYMAGDGSIGVARVSLVADTRGTKGYVASVVERDSARSAVRVIQATPGDPMCVERTPVKLGIIAEGGNPVATLRAAALGIDALTGQDIYQSVVDWDHLADAFAAAPSGGLPQTREYRFTPGADSFLAVLIDELRLRGMYLTMRRGRITGVRLSSLADTESTVATVTEADLLTEGGAEIPVEVIDNTEPLATSIAFSLPRSSGDPTIVTVTDTTFSDEFGVGESVECKALLSLPASVSLDVSTTLSPLYAIAQQVLGPLAEPSRGVRLPLTPLLMGVQPGDLVGLTHTRIPTWLGTRGITAAVCQVQEVRRVLFGGRLRATATVRLQSSAAVGYCPEVMVAAGGLAASPVVTIDATTGWGAQCHAQDADGAGDLSTLATAGFVVGDKVVLSQANARGPIADEAFTVVAVSTSTVTLDGNPSGAMVTAAAGQYGVTLRWAAYDTATTRQHTAFAWIADAGGTLGGAGDGPKRWAA